MHDLGPLEGGDDTVGQGGDDVSADFGEQARVVGILEGQDLARAHPDQGMTVEELGQRGATALLCSGQEE
jgi:hypothetical protein